MRLERLEGDLIVAVVIVADRVEVELAAGDREVVGPPVAVAPEGDGAAGLHPVHHVGAARQRRLQRRLREVAPLPPRSEEHTSELQSLMRNSYAVFCLKKKTIQ